MIYNVTFKIFVDLQDEFETTMGARSVTSLR